MNSHHLKQSSKLSSNHWHHFFFRECLELQEITRTMCNLTKPTFSPTVPVIFKCTVSRSLIHSFIHSINLLKKAFATWQQAFLSTGIAFYNIITQARAEIKILSFWTRRWPMSLSFSLFFLLSSFFAFPFSPFLIFLLQWLTLYWACFPLKNYWENIIKMGKFFHKVAKCSGRKFCSEFFTKFLSIFVHISDSWANHFDLGIIEKIVSFCRSWV